LDFKKIKEIYPEILLETPIIMVLKADGEEIVIHDYGEILFKTCTDKEKMKKIADKIYSAKK
jgi:hypothetical protein